MNNSSKKNILKSTTKNIRKLKGKNKKKKMIITTMEKSKKLVPWEIKKK